MYEDDPEYAARRLNNTLVRKANGNPFYITRTTVSEDGVLTHRGEDFVTDEAEYVPHSSLDLEPVPLGFVNVNANVVYVCRKPMRRDWRQGLSHNSMMTYGHLRPEDLNVRTLVQPILKQYPSFQRALSDISRRTAIAFSRDFAIVNQGVDVILQYRQHRVGRIVDGVAILDPNKAFLQQYLDEVVA